MSKLFPSLDELNEQHERREELMERHASRPTRRCSEGEIAGIVVFIFCVLCGALTVIVDKPGVGPSVIVMLVTVFAGSFFAALCAS